MEVGESGGTLAKAKCEPWRETAGFYEGPFSKVQNVALSAFGTKFRLGRKNRSECVFLSQLPKYPSEPLSVFRRC